MLQRNLGQSDRFLNTDGGLHIQFLGHRIEVAIDDQWGSIGLQVHLDHTGKDIHTQVYLLKGVVDLTQRTSLGPDDLQFLLGKSNPQTIPMKPQSLVGIRQIGLDTLWKGQRNSPDTHDVMDPIRHR